MTPRRFVAGVGRRVRRLRERWRLARLTAMARLLRAVRPGPATEERILRMNWASRDAARLDEYLVIGWQNPRINIQSLLIRHALVRQLFGAEFDALMRDEIAFAVQLNEQRRQEAARQDFVIHSYLDAARQARIREISRVISPREHEFESRWRTALSGRSAGPLSVLEFACGSANDYRAFVDYGIASFLDYAGIDLNPKNIENARRRFPDANFSVGNVLETGAADRSIDYVIVSDLFEHLPIPVATRAASEAARIARVGLILSFFNMADVPDHQDRPTAAYHWNLMSRGRFEAQLKDAFPDVRVVSIPAWLEAEFGYPHTYNPAAWTMVAERRPGLT